MDFQVAKRARCFARMDSEQILTLHNIVTSDNQAIGLPFFKGCDENEVGFFLKEVISKWVMVNLLGFGRILGLETSL
jgi:hypothetical protein